MKRAIGLTKKSIIFLYFSNLILIWANKLYMTFTVADVLMSVRFVSTSFRENLKLTFNPLGLQCSHIFASQNG